MANFDSIVEIPAQPPVNEFNEFARGGHQAFRMGNNMPCRIYICTASAASHELPTGLSRVLGGFVFSPTSEAVDADAQVKPYADGNGSVAQVTGIAAEAGLIVVVYGQI